MNRLRAERALQLLRNVNAMRAAWTYVPGCRCGCVALHWAEEALRAFDDDCRARSDPRQLTIWEALHPP